MSARLRPCPGCGRHYGDEPACPFCGSAAPRMPVAPAWMLPEARPAPKYGGPPLVRTLRLATLLLVVGLAVGALAAALLWR
ncbi:MAG: hypothetical protein KF729_10735 [Sandaracinaceae bacterium]|nr:hypothetical protein [Sandaracinaceae bacterium]